MRPRFCVALAATALLCTVPAIAHADTTFNRLRVDAHGRLAGVILSDGTEVVTTPSQGQALARIVHPGDAVRLSTGPRNTVALTDPRSGHSLNLGSTDGVARGGGPVSPAVPYAPVDNARGLTPLWSEGRVAMVLHTPNGDPSGFVMANGTQVHVVPGVEGVLRDVHRGEWLRVEGRGTQGPSGTGMWALFIGRPNRQVLLDMSRGAIGAPELGLGR